MSSGPDFEAWLQSAVGADGDPSVDPADPSAAHALAQAKAEAARRQQREAVVKLGKMMKALIATGYGQHQRLTRLAGAYADLAGRVVDLRASHRAEIAKLEADHKAHRDDIMAAWNGDRARHGDLPVTEVIMDGKRVFGRIEFTVPEAVAQLPSLQGIFTGSVVQTPSTEEPTGAPVIPEGQSIEATSFDFQPTDRCICGHERGQHYAPDSGGTCSSCDDCRGFLPRPR